MLAIREELGLPVKFIGVGESIDDLQPFDAEDFAEALFAREETEEALAADRRIAAGRQFDEYGEELEEDEESIWGERNANKGNRQAVCAGHP